MNADAAQLPPHQPNCMGCGHENSAGIGLRMRRDGEVIRGEVTFDRRHEGAPGFAHGGAISTALDDALGFVLLLLERPAVTARLEVDFRRPAFLGRRYEVEAWAEAINGRKLSLAAVLRDERSGIVAEASGLFLGVEAEHFSQSGSELPAEWSRNFVQASE